LNIFLCRVPFYGVICHFSKIFLGNGIINKIVLEFVMSGSLQYSFYTMLYIKEKNISLNMAENAFLTIIGYIHCCKTLDESLKRVGQKLTVLTNEPDVIINEEPGLNVQKIEFELIIPDNIKFFSAHHKIDVFKYLSLYGDAYSILLDNDMVCINNVPENIYEIVNKNVPMYYDVTDQCYPAYGRSLIMNEKTLLMGINSIGSWAGGEFIGGDKIFFDRIYGYCKKYWNIYISNFTKLHHQGDEMLVSCAIEEYFLKGNPIINIGTMGCVGRYWSVKTLHIGKPFEALLDNLFLHLPADKEYLAEYKEGSDFITDYKKYLRNIKRKESIIKGYIKKTKRIIKRIIYK
jgi:hypothetical protein